MICNSCKNKNICKHYEYINNILIDITVQITACELYTNNNLVQNKPTIPERPQFRQPLPSTYVDEEDDIDDDEEKVYIDMSTVDKIPQSATIVDLIMKGDQEDGKENR
jgi:hypothetical protein